MPFIIVRQDITKLNVDAIVNAANTDLKMGGGVCGAIFKWAGAEELQAACDKLAPIRTGEAVITPGFHLPAKYVIHAAGPVYQSGNKQESARYLRAAYTNALKRATEHECNSIAFPLISSGIYGYPKDEALQVATAAIRDYLEEHDMDVTLAVFDKEAFYTSEELLGEVASYINENYVDEYLMRRRRRLLNVEVRSLEKAESHAFEETMLAPSMAPAPLDTLMESLDEPFSRTLLRLIDLKGKTDVQVYKSANIDRKLFSKIRSSEGYTPSKRTAIALAVALELSLEETADLLARAGYALSRSVKFDVIVEYFIRKGKCDVLEINQVLFGYDQPLLGG